MRFFKITRIKGCEAHGNANEVYMTRYTIFECRLFQICIHVFNRSDPSDHHDHPWNFVSIPIWNGYFEEQMHCFDCGYALGSSQHAGNKCEVHDFHRTQWRVRPGMVLFRKATHRHRVVLLPGKKAVTLVIMGKRFRPWGFFTKDGWIKYTKYFIKNGC